MYAKRLIEIGMSLGPIQREIQKRNLEISMLGEDNARIELQLTPADGWPGSNEAARKASKDKAVTDNVTIQANLARIRSLKLELSALTGDEVILENERRSLEYAVRDRLADALVIPEEQGGDVDKVQDHAQIDNLAQAVLPTDESPRIQESAPTSITTVAAATPAPVEEIGGMPWDEPAAPAPVAAAPVVAPEVKIEKPSDAPKAGKYTANRPAPDAPKPKPKGEEKVLSEKETEDLIHSLGF